MVNKKIIAIILLLIFSWWYFLPSDLRIIKRQLTEISKQLSFPETEHPIESAARVKTITRYMAMQVNGTVSFENETKTQDFTKNDIQQYLLAFGRKASPVKVSLKDLSVKMTSKNQATATFTALVEQKNENTYDAQEIETHWKKEDSKWLLYKVSNVKVIY